jgi:carbohydrate-binding DOMON domain-containing protein
LKHEEVKRASNKAKTLIFKKDEVKDEFYQYPASKNFAEGILDLREFILKEDETNYYFELKFRNLVNPGWHIEYGYQLTLTSICIQNNSNEKLNKKVGANSNYNLPEEFAFNTQILVGGGFEIKNAYDVTVAAYIPKEIDVSNPLGNVADRSISFSIPKYFLGEIKSDSRIAVLVGAQDDHGGAGIGEFREVSSEPTEWTGGGKSDPAEHNVYDWLFIK